MNDLSKLTFDQLLAMRQAAPPSAQGILAPYEHMAYARETVRNDPMSAPGLLAMITAYQLAKILRLTPRDERSTGPSMAQLLAGYRGVGEGLLSNFRQ